MKPRTNVTLAAVMMMAAVRNPLFDPPTDAEKCARCGQPMVLDALGEMWMCGNFACGMDVPDSVSGGRDAE